MLDLSDQGAWVGERKKAATLEGLQSPSGRLYHEETESSSPSPIHLEPRYAQTDFEVVPGHNDEVAYWCDSEGLWIQGTPSGEPYNDIRLLSGSAGLKLVCRSCGSEVGRLVEKMS